MKSKTPKPPTSTKLRAFTLPTQDDWYPCFPRNTVQINVYERHTPKEVRGGEPLYAFQVTVWGADDTGMERHTYVPKAKLDETRTAILREVDDFPNPLNRDWLKARGFVGA